MLSKFDSDKFRFWAFVSMVLLVFVHGYNVEPRYLQPWTAPAQAFTWSRYVEYLFANGLLRFRIPMLFAISGYLYALHDATPNRDRVRKRVRTLLVPYLLWSAIALLMYYLLETVPATRAWIVGSHTAQIDQTRMLVHDYHCYEVLARWLLFPLAYQLWFIRVLFVYNLAYPLLRRWIEGTTSRRVLFAVAVLMWLGTMDFLLFEGEGLLFFCLGVWLCKSGFNIDAPRAWLQPRKWLLVLLGAAAVKSWLAFGGQALMGGAVFPLMLVLHKLTVFSGLVCAWYGCDPLVRWCMARPWFLWLVPFSFIIYAMHAPWVAVLIDPAMDALGRGPGVELAAFVLLPVAILVVVIAFGAALRRLAPAVYATLTGGRGL